MRFYMYNNMNLCYIILLNYLALVNVFAIINAREEVLTNFGDIKENYMKLGNISRAKRAIVSLCSNINSKPLLPCAFHGQTSYQEQESWKFFFLTHILLSELLPILIKKIHFEAKIGLF